MSNKEIGSLLVKMQGNSNSLVKSIDNTINSLANLSKGLKEIQNTSLKGLTSKFTTMANAMTKFANSFNEGTVKRIRSISASMYQMGNSLKSFTNMNLNLIGMNFTRLSYEIDPFLRKLQDSEGLLKSFNYALDVGKLVAQLQLANGQVSLLNEKVKTEQIRREKVARQLDLVNNKLALANKRQENLNVKTSFWNNIWKIGKLDYFSRTLTRIARKFGSILTMGAEFNETLNKFQSATRENYQDAIMFARQMAKEFGLAEETVMNYQSTFSNMLGSLEGLSNEMVNNLSKSLTVMAVDYASLFNTTIESAMTAFQSVLSGRTTAIRSASGIDVTQNTIYEYYKELGGTKTLNALSQLEKRLLRILAVYKQMNEAMALGDMQNTIESFSNQSRILSEQLKEIGVWFSNIFIKLMENVMPYVNAMAITIKELLKSFAYFLGYEQQKSKPGIFDKNAEEVDNLNENLKETMGLLSFDKFNVLTSSASSENASDIEKIYAEMEKEMLALQESLNSVNMKANQISDSILTWLGYSKEVHQVYEDIYDEMGNVIGKELIDERTIWTLKEGNTKMAIFLNLLKVLGTSSIVLFASKTIISLLGTIQKLSNGLNVLSKSMSLISTNPLISTISIILGIASLLYYTNENFRESVNALFNSVGNLFKLLEPSLNKLLIPIFNILNLILGIILPIVNLVINLSSALISLASITTYFLLPPLEILISALGVILNLLRMVFIAIDILLTPLKMVANVFSDIFGNFSGNISGFSSSIKINEYAGGGNPTPGELFIAREKGPEFIGSMGGKTTVANNYQIEQGIEEASYRGFVRAMQENGGYNTLVIDGSNVNDSAFVRAIMPALRMEQSRTGGR